eukprot:COSAG05_NODE_22448_length_265_cov_0.530120_1_plen_59_part_10
MALAVARPGHGLGQGQVQGDRAGICVGVSSLEFRRVRLASHVEITLTLVLVLTFRVNSD